MEYSSNSEEAESSSSRDRYQDTLPAWYPDLNVPASNFENPSVTYTDTYMIAPDSPYIFESSDIDISPDSVMIRSTSINEIADQLRSSSSDQPLDKFLPSWIEQDSQGRLTFPLKPLLRGNLFGTSQSLDSRIALAWIKSAREGYFNTVNNNYHTNMLVRRGNSSACTTRAVRGDSLKPIMTRSLVVSAETMIQSGSLQSATLDHLNNNDEVKDTLYGGANILMDALVDNPSYNLHAGDAKTANGSNQGMPRIVLDH